MEVNKSPRKVSLFYHLDPKCGKKSSCNRTDDDPKKYKYAHTCKFCGNKDKVMDMGKWTPEQLTAYRQELRTFRETHKAEKPTKQPRQAKASPAAPIAPTVPAQLKVPTAPIVA